MKNIAIIPARAGSKGLPDKNIKLLNGKPLLQYSVEAALGSGCFDKVMVSTDSEKYAEIAREAGAEVPFLRSAYTSTDKASSWDMVEEVLDGYERLGWTFDTFCLLQPTSPMRTGSCMVVCDRADSTSLMKLRTLLRLFTFASTFRVFIGISRAASAILILPI